MTDVCRAFSREVPRIGDPAKLLGLTIVVVAECQQCPAHEQLALVNAQTAVCPSCGATVGMDHLEWDRHQPVPTITLNATRPVGA